MEKMSKLRPVSFGIAAENLPMNSRELEVIPREWLPYLDGELNSDAIEVEVSGVDHAGQNYTATALTASSVAAEWLSFDSNRSTPPNIRRGERVMLYQFANSDKYYWTDLGMDTGLRRRETVVFMFSNTTDENVKILTPDNSYFIEVSTHTKQITLKTNKSDGEPFAYTFQFNTKEGVVTLADDDDNYIEFDSQERKITAKNKDTSFITIDKRIIKAFAPDLIHMQTKAIEAHCETMLIEASQTLTENVGQSVTINTTNYELNASAAIDMSTAAMTINASTLQGNIGAATFTGTVTILGLATLAGGLAAVPGGGGGATATISVPMTTNEPVTANAEITVNGIPVSTHKHTEQGDGAPVSPPIP